MAAINLAKTHKLVFGTFCLQKLITHRYIDKQTNRIHNQPLLDGWRMMNSYTLVSEQLVTRPLLK